MGHRLPNTTKSSPRINTSFYKETEAASALSRLTLFSVEIKPKSRDKTILFHGRRMMRAV